jgi:hypothetical protein
VIDTVGRDHVIKQREITSVDGFGKFAECGRIDLFAHGHLLSRI